MKRLLILLCVIANIMTGCKKEKPAKIHAQSISFNVKTMEMTVGEDYLLEYTILPEDVTDKSVTWSSSNEKVATVSSEGLINAVTKGKVSIYATTENNITGNLVVNVFNKVNEVTSVAFDKTKLQMEILEKATLTATILPTNASIKRLQWASSDEKIAKVNNKGEIETFTEAGKATITATSNNNKVATCALTVIIGDPKPINPCVFTNNTNKEQSISLMSSELTYCEIDGVIKAIKVSNYEPDAYVPSNLKTINEIVTFRKKQLKGWEPSEFKVPAGKSIKIYDQTKIECVWSGEFTTECKFSQWTDLMFWSSGDFHCPGFNFNNSTDLDVILIQYAPSIKHINISNCTKLQYYTVAVTNVEEADFSRCTRLKHCACVNSTVKRIDLSNSPVCFMVIVGADVDAPGVLEEVILCPELEETGYYWFSWNNKATTYPDNFKVRFLIDKNPNTPNLEKRYKQVFDCLAYSEFDGKYIVQTKAGEACWSYDSETFIWSQKEGDVSDNYYDMSFYKGDLNENGTGYYWSNIISKDLVWNNASEQYSGTGFIALIDFNSTLVEDVDHAAPAEGIYTVGKSHDAMTVNDGYDSVITYYKDGKSTEKEVKSGSLEIKHEIDKIVFICDFILSDDSAFKFTYRKDMKFLNRTEDGKHSNIEEDKIITDLTKGKLIYWGNQYEESDMYNIVLAGADYDINSNDGNANALNLTINATLNSAGELPTGEYKIIDSANESFPVNTALSGMYMSKYSMYWGCMYYNNANQEEAAITRGVITITNNGSNNYTVVVDCYDGYDNKIKGTYTGTFDYQEETANNYKFKKKLQ